MNFNLVDDPWVSVLIGKQQHTLSLFDIFSKADKISSIAEGTVEKIAITRLLLCISQAALNGPDDDKSWELCKNNIIPLSLDYLKNWHDRFDLFGDYPFLQITELKNINNHNIAFLNPSFASGANHTFFDSAARGKEDRVISESDIVKSLLVSQIFAECGRKGGAVKDTTWGISSIKDQTKAATATNILITIINGSSLLNTIHSNIINKEWLNDAKIQFGQPVWEQKFINQNDKLTENSRKTYLYNLVPISRGILFEKDSNIISFCPGISPCEFPVYRDPMGTIVSKKIKNKVEPGYLKIDTEKAPWRDLQSILKISPDKLKYLQDGPWAMRHFNKGNSNKLIITTGGFAYDKAKPKLACEWQFIVPSKMLSKQELSMYSGYVDNAEKALNKSKYAFEIYLNFSDKKLSFSDKDNKKVYISLLSKSEKRYWYKLSKKSQEILEKMSNASNPMTAQEIEDITKFWNSVVYKSVLDSFQKSCGEYQKNFMSYTKALLWLKQNLKEILK